jgi:hypothetical protein
MKSPDVVLAQPGYAGCNVDIIIARIDEGVRVTAGYSEATAITGRGYQKRTLPV